MGTKDERSSRGSVPAMSRRGFLGASGAMGAAALIPGRVGGLVEAVAPGERAEVVVVGAGPAGLAAAGVLHAAGIDVLVLEASEQPGGRVTSAASGTTLTTLVPASHEAVLALAQRMGQRTRIAEASGTGVVAVGGTFRRVPSGSLTGDPDLDREVGVALSRLNLMAAEVDPGLPWATDNASVRDALSLGSWVSDNVGSDAGRAFLGLVARAVWAAEPAEVSLLHALATIAGAGGVGPLINATLAPGWRGPELVEENGARETTCRACRPSGHPWASVPRAEVPAAQVVVEGGIAALTQGLLDSVATHVRTSAPVRRVAEDATGLNIEGPGFTVQAARVIIALPPAAAAQIGVEPTLTGDQRGLLGLKGGEVVSVVCTYAGPFWEAGGLLGRAAGDGVLTVAEARREGSTGVIVAHACGAPARAWMRMAEAERKAAALGTLGEWFGAAAGSPLSYREHDWRAGASGAVGWSVVAPPGAVTSLMRVLREPHGRVHWAGAERAVSWSGWLEGALRSGEHAARQVLGAMSGAPTAGAIL